MFLSEGRAELLFVFVIHPIGGYLWDMRWRDYITNFGVYRTTLQSFQSVVCRYRGLIERRRFLSLPVLLCRWINALRSVVSGRVVAGPDSESAARRNSVRSGLWQRGYVD